MEVAAPAEDVIELSAESTWDLVCEAGRLARQNMDDGRWIIGDLALQVDKEYGQDKIAEADEVEEQALRAVQARSEAKDLFDKREAEYYERLTNRPDMRAETERIMRLGDAADDDLEDEDEDDEDLYEGEVFDDDEEDDQEDDDPDIDDDDQADDSDS